ncbi:hypothetical protein ERAN111884_00385 [Erysipelothrix anatis]
MKQKESIPNFLIIFAGNLLMFLILFYRSMSLSEILIKALIITVVYMILKKYIYSKKR